MKLIGQKLFHIGTYRKKKDYVFEKANLSGFGTWKFLAKEALIPQISS